MKQKEITVNGYTFTVESTIGDVNCFRLCYGNIPVLADTACEDFYGDIDTVADVMEAYISEEANKQFPWFTLLGALVEQDGDPTIIEDEETAKEWAETINGGSVREQTDSKEVEVAKGMLNLDGCDVKHIYAFDNGNGNAGHFCLSRDY